MPSADALFQNLDSDHSGKITKQEFAVQMGGDWEELEEIWSKLDQDDDGEVDKEEMQYAMAW